MERPWAFGAVGIVLAVAGLALLLSWDRTDLGVDLLALIAVGTAVVAFVVGWGLGYYADRDIRPGRRGRKD